MTTWEVIATCFVCAIVGFIIGATIVERVHRAQASAIHRRLARAFHPDSLTCLTVAERQFPARIRADLHRALNNYFRETARIAHLCGVRVDNDMFGIDLSDLLTAGVPASEVPLQNEEVNIGEGEIVHCPRNALWIARAADDRFAVLVSKVLTINEPPRVKVHIATTPTEQGRRIARELFERLELAVQRAASYRGKVLSLDTSNSYSGEGTGIKVHSISPVHRDDVVLPADTLRLIERNTLEFVAHRARLRSLGQSTKKGLLFYGPPGNGKTYTIRYLIAAIQGHTTLLITGGQIGQLADYMELARLLQPALVVIEDVDLVAKEKVHSGTSCEEPLLNLLLNEMDGLTADSEIIFVLTTNRPELLEEALAARPGRIDQAVEFGSPGVEERIKLARLYSPGITIATDVVDEIARVTEGASAAFVKELMRRAVQCHLAIRDEAIVASCDVRKALEELVLNRGPLNARILGYTPVPTPASAEVARHFQNGCDNE